MRTYVINLVFISALTIRATSYAQESSQTADAETVLDPSPFVSTRAASMGGALSTLADDMDAIYYNPAGLGRLGFSGKADPGPFVRGFYFPYAGLSLNQKAGSVRNEFNSKNASKDAQAGAAVMDANAGDRQYARASVVPMGVLFGRAAIVPLLDSQIAAVPQGGDTGEVKLRYRSFSGLLVGTSVADNANRFSLGFSQVIGTIEETYGTFKYVDMVDVQQRKAILSENRKTYAAKGTNVGMTMRIPKSIVPTFSLVARNIGNTKNSASKNGDSPLIYEEDLTAGISISPPVGRIGRLNMIVEGGYLSQKEMSARKKVRGGMELLLGGSTSKSLAGIRAGGNDAGWSAGLHLNLDLIGVEIESHAVDVGINNNRLIERRQSIVGYIDLASF